MKYDYDLTVIGGGAGGLTAAGIGANLGAKTLLIEADKLGGDCTWYGCVPSKTLIHLAKVAHHTQKAEKFGMQTAKGMDFAKVMEHVRNIRQKIYEEADEPDIYRNMGVDVTFGSASFVDDHTVSVQTENGKKQISSRFIIIATGSKASVPQIDGLNDVVYYTNETIFDLKEQPRRLVIIGAGPEGLELGQAFQRLGTEISVLETHNRILPYDDVELAELLLNRLKSEKVDINLSASVNKMKQNNEGEIQIHYQQDGKEKILKSNCILLASGRTANFGKLKLDAIGVDHNRDAVTVDSRCRTNISHIYAVGDVTGRYPFTHMAEHMAKVAVVNALLKVPMKIDEEHVTWCTFTDPELARVGASEEELKKQNKSHIVYRFPYSKIDRAITEDATEGFIKIFAKKRSGKILGAAIYGKQAGDLIGEYALAMKNGVTLRNIADTIHPYPTYGLGLRRTADQWYIKNQSEWMIKLIKKIFGYRGPIPDLSDENRIV